MTSWPIRAAKRLRSKANSSSVVASRCSRTARSLKNNGALFIVRPQRRSQLSDFKRGFDFRIRDRIAVGQSVNLAAFQSSERQTVSEGNAIRGKRSDPRSRRENPLQVQRVGRAQRDQFHIWRRFSYRSQQTNRFRKRELFAAHAGDEIPAADFTARFKSPINAAEFVPAHAQTFAFEQSSRHHAITTQQDTRKFVDRSIASSRVRAVGICRQFFTNQRPASGKFDACKICFPPTFSFVTPKGRSFVRRNQQSTQTIKAVARHKSERGQFRESFFNL